MDHQTDAPHRRSWPSRASVAAPAALAALLALVMLLVTGSVVMAADSDGDGLRDAFERRYELTDPERRDSDGDGVVDSAEDPDDDRLGNLGEQRFGTDPGDRDSDGDGRSDGHEDADRDGRSNARQQDRRPLPAGLRPSLARAHADAPTDRAACLAKAESAAPTVCAFGPEGSDGSIALMGDSHALMWLPPMIAAAQSEGWRLVALLKGGCTPVLGTLNAGQYRLDGGISCRRWRRAAFSMLEGQPVDLLVLAHADSYGLVDAQGREIRPRRKADVWRRGMKRTLAALPDAGSALLLGDVPRNQGNPIRCLRKHRANMARCVSPREPLKERVVESALRSAARSAGAMHRTLFGRICTYDPCPLVQGDVLIWRDRHHLTATFARRLTPSLRTLLGSALANSAARSRATQGSPSIAMGPPGMEP